jgi:hypothetical protein
MNERRPKFPPLFDGDLALPDLAQWVAFYGGYDRVTPPAWATPQSRGFCSPR